MQHRRHQQGDRERPRASGFAHYLLKPVAPERLAESLERARRRLAAGRGRMADALADYYESVWDSDLTYEIGCPGNAAMKARVTS